MTAPLPSNEPERLAALHQNHILDTPPEKEFDDLVQLAAHICGAPIAAVSLVDTDRQWFKSILGLDISETPRDMAFCAHTILQDGVLIVPDSHADPRFVDNPLVTGNPKVRFYAGATLLTDGGHALGSLCVIDRVPRQLTPEQQIALRILARQVSNQMELTRRIRLQEQLMAERAAAEAERQALAAIVEASADSIVSANLTGKILSWNKGAERLYGFTAQEIVGQSQTLLVPPGESSVFSKFLPTLLQYGRLENLEVVRQRKDGKRVDVSQTLSLIRDDAGEPFAISVVGRDITEKKRVERDLQRSEARLREAQQLAQIGSWEFDPATGQIFWSEALFHLFGLDPANGTPSVEELMTYYHPDDVPMHRAVVARALADGLPYEFDIRILHWNGTVRWAHAVGRGEWDASGDVMRLVGTLLDIHERKIMEEALRESKRFIESIAEASTSIIFVLDLDTKTNVYANRSVTEFLGYSAEQVREMGEDLLPAMLHPDDLHDVLSHFAQFAGTADGDVVEIEYRARQADGTWRWIWNRESVFKRHPDGTPWQILGTAYDVTERREAQEEAMRLAAIVESSQDAILGATLDGTLVSWNAGAERLYGYTEAEVFGQHASCLDPPAERDFIGEIIWAILRGERRENIEVKRQRRGGEWIDVSLTFSPIKNNLGAITGVAAMGRDITEQKEAEQTLKDFSVVLEFQKQELEKVNAELAMLATVDGLTGLANRRAFDERLLEAFERASRYHEPLSLLLLDIDHFKGYNDTFGHLAGDAVLRQIGRVLQNSTRATDIVARYGGEEIAVILVETDSEGAMQVAERVRRAIASAPWQHRLVTASLGVSTLHLGMQHAEDMVAQADHALYHSKTQGRDRFTHAASLPEATEPGVV